MQVEHKMQDREKNAILRIFAWADAAYCLHPDSKSQTGMCFALGLYEPMFYFSSTKQPNVTLSSCESENEASVTALKEIIWFRNLLEEMGFPQLEPTILYSDNQSNIQLSIEFSGNHKSVKQYL
jgi:hypothetical protein